MWLSNFVNHSRHIIHEDDVNCGNTNLNEDMIVPVVNSN